MTNEDRIWKHYKALRKSYAIEDWNTKSNEIWLTLARTHKISVREIKDIIQARKKENL